MEKLLVSAGGFGDTAAKMFSRRLLAGDLSLLTTQQKALVVFACKLTAEPSSMRRSDTDKLRAVGLDDRAILDLVQVIAYYGYVNRLVAGLGVPLGVGEGPPGQ